MDEVLKKLTEHDKKFIEHDKKFAEHDKRFDAIDKKLAEHDERFDLIACTLLDHSERLDRIEEKLDNMATKDEISKIVSTFDAVVSMYKKKDEEMIILTRDVRRLDDKVEEHDRDIKKMKPALGLS